VYVHLDAAERLVLTTDDGIESTNRIVLEEAVLRSLLTYIGTVDPPITKAGQRTAQQVLERTRAVLVNERAEVLKRGGKTGDAHADALFVARALSAAETIIEGARRAAGGGGV
jgi:hypothetical protein